MTRRWQDDATCARGEHVSDLNVWWGETPSDVYRAKRICATCPVLMRCARTGLVEVLTRDPELDPCDIGIWGGLTGRELADFGGEEPSSVHRLKRDQAVGLFLAGASAIDAARALDVPFSTAQGWRKEALRVVERAA